MKYFCITLPRLGVAALLLVAAAPAFANKANNTLGLRQRKYRHSSRANLR
jgi:hypothetical protein